MKLKTATLTKFTAKLEKGTYIRLDDNMDLHNGVYFIEAHDDFNLVMRNTKTNKQLIIRSTDDLSRYNFEIGIMQFVADRKETLKEPIKEPTKAECEAATEEYSKHIMEAIREALGNNVRVVNLAR